MQELITRLTQKAGITAEQASKSIEAIKEYVTEKFPMMAGAVDNLLASQSTHQPDDTTAPPIPSPSMMDKISDIIPGETGEKIEEFTKKAASKAEGLYDGAKERLNDLLKGDKSK